MQIPITDITAKMTSALQSQGYSAEDIPFLINMYLGGELRGHTSHGLASFPGFIQQGRDGSKQPEVIKETHALCFIDARSASGNVVGRRAADEAIKRAKAEGVGTTIIKNMDSWLRPGAIAEYTAEQGVAAIVVNSGGGASIAPPGGYDPVIGTNPIAYGIPTDDGPLVVDMATAKRAWGQVRLANKYGTDLPADTFYDDQGNVTLDPKKAWSVMPSGEYKGFALALMIEMLCCSLVGMPVMVDTKNAGSNYGVPLMERGGIIIAIDPEHLGGLAEFKRANSELITKIKATRPLTGERIRIPGEQATAGRNSKLTTGTIDIPDELWEEIQAL